MTWLLKTCEVLCEWVYLEVGSLGWTTDLTFEELLNKDATSHSPTSKTRIPVPSSPCQTMFLPDLFTIVSVNSYLTVGICFVFVMLGI